MKNFVRTLRYAWTYRGRLGVSIACAFMAAAFWSVNFTAVYPILKILSDERTLQDWVEERIQATQKEIDKWQASVDHYQKESKDLEEKPASPARSKRERDLASDLAKYQSKLDSETTALYRYQVAKKYIFLFFPHDRFQSLMWVVVMVVIAVAVKGFFEFWQESLVGSAVNLSLFDLRNQFYRKVIHLDVRNFSDTGTGELMARFTNDMELVGVGLKTLFGKVIAEPLKALGCVILACWISWQLTFMFLILVPIALFILTKVGRMMKRATRRLLERMSNIYKILQETFQGIRVVKAFTMEPYERRRFYSATKDYYHKAMMVVNIDALAGPIVEILGVVAVALALLAGAYLVLQHETHLFGIRMTSQPLEVESLLQLYVMLAAIADPVRKLSSVYTKLQSGTAAADRVFAYLDREPQVQGNSNNYPLPRHHAGIEFRDVCFSYDKGRPILTNVHLDVRHGETVALVGKNGCGKTTLVGLIPRFYDVDHGSILVDGHDIRNVNLRSLRQQIGLVTQETILFDDTIAANIAYGYRRASREQVEEAAKRAFAHDFIQNMAEGYDTRLGEAGNKLSGGQKQRIALARAILRDPSIFILDEFTSQADVESENLVHRALKDFMKNRTTLVITHRLNTLEIADRIIVVDNGRIEAVGTHPDLLRTCAVYQRLHDAQFHRLCA